MSNGLHREATLFTQALFHCKPDAKVIARYEEALGKTIRTITRQDEKVLRFAVAHPWSITILDAGLALLHPYAELRRRLYLLFAIVETQPAYADLFLYKQRGVFHVFYILWTTARSTVRAVLGVMLVKGIR